MIETRVRNTSGTILTASGSSGTPISGGTVGSVLFVGATGGLAQDNANFFWDDTLNRFGVGNNSPGAQLHVTSGAAATIGLIVRGAASQSAYLTEWQNSSGTVVALVGPNGGMALTSAAEYFQLQSTTGYIGLTGDNSAALVSTGYYSPGGLSMESTAIVRWTNDSTFFGTTDTAMARNAAGVVEINNGTSGTYRDLFVRNITLQTPTGGNVLSGTYTPTLTNVANLDASTAYECQYIRVGSVVTVSGKVDIDPTLTATSTQLGISLPIASNIGAAEDCSGTAFASGIAGQGAAILGDATNDRAQLQYISGDVTNQAMYFTFTYQII